ncbi:MAG: hypothetical protein JNK56_33360 [Myxococcales bacterium]|nr:hypothetical protein [Myxococcales bacterium]
MRTIVIALIAQCIAALTAAGWVSATLVTGLLLGMFAAHTLRHGDALLARILLFGLVVGFGELPADHFGVVVTRTLVYSPGGPHVWVSPLYMPFGWVVMMTQLGVLALAAAPRLGRARTCVALAIAGGLNIPVHELLAKHADLWHYQNTPALFGVVPHYVILAEALLAFVIPLLLLRLSPRTRWSAVVGLGAAQACFIYLAGRIAHALVG